MKTLLLALLFCQFVMKIYSLSRLEDVTAEKLTELKREWKEVEESNSKLTAKLAELFDERSPGEQGSGEKPRPNPEEKGESKALREIVDALRKHIVPSVVKASKRRDEEIKEYASELVKMLQDEADKQELMQALGKTVIEMHVKCDKIQAGFLKLANESEALEKMESGTKSFNQALKAFVIIDKLLSEATCGDPANELVDLVEKTISKEDPSDPFPDLQDRIISLLGLGDAKPPKACKNQQDRSGLSLLSLNITFCTCTINLAHANRQQEWRNALVDKNYHTPVSPQEKMLRLVLEVPKNILCKDVPVATRYLDITMEAIELHKKIDLLMTVDAAQQFTVTNKIKSLISQDRYNEAAKLVGETGFDGLRKKLLIGLTVKMRQDAPKPKPTLKPKGLKELFDLDSVIRASRK